jgi:dienelactone hydrolase
MRGIGRWGLWGAVLLLVAASFGAGYTKSEAASTNAARYAAAGPHKVGYTTLRMNDRDVDVWYPAAAAAAKGKPKATYDQKAPLPADLQSFVPDAYNTVVTMKAYREVKGSSKGPFPVVLFSHGVGAYRMASSALLAGIASWGFVIVSADYVERGVVTQLPGQTPSTLDAERDKRLMLASLDLVTTEGDRPGSVLHRVVDARRVGAVGHSAGGTAAFDALEDPRVKVAVGWAPAAPSAAPPAAKPTMIIGAADDLSVTAPILAQRYESLPAPTRRVEIGNAGHNSFTDLCVVLKSGGGVVQFAIDNRLIPESLATLVVNGCEDTALTPEKFWPVAQHFTVAELRTALGIDATPVGLGARAARAFPGITVTYQAR